MHFEWLTKRIAIFLKSLIGKTYVRNGVDVNNLKPQFLDLVGHQNV